jgi:hypothetical protein
MSNPQKTLKFLPAKPRSRPALTGDDIDLTTLPFRIQHEHDGAPTFRQADFP